MMRILVYWSAISLLTAGTATHAEEASRKTRQETQPMDRTIVQTLFEGKTVDAWDTGRDAKRLRNEFHSAAFEHNPEEQALLWTFVPRNVRFNDLFLRRQIRGPFDELVLTVRNTGSPFTLAVKVRDANGAEWTAAKHTLPTGDQWRNVAFPRPDWKTASWSEDPDGCLDFPLSFLAVIAFDIKPGNRYRIEIRRVHMHIPEPPTAQIRNLRLPRDIAAGEEVTLGFEFRLDRPCRLPGARLTFGTPDAPSFTARVPMPARVPELPTDEWLSTEMPLRIPRYARGGLLPVFLHVGEARVQVETAPADSPIARVTLTPRVPGETAAGVAVYNGAPTLHINGQPRSGMAYMAYRPSANVFTDFAQAGVKLFSISATPTEAGYGLSRTAWTAPGTFDFSQLDERIMMILEAQTDAAIFPRLYLHAPKWWSEKHPEHVVRHDPGDGKTVPFIHREKLPAPSWASELWRKDTVEGLRKLVEHVEDSPYADRVIGYHIASGTTEEWMMWGANERLWVDYSPVNVTRFRNWLRKRYTIPDALREAWNQPAVTFNNAPIPTRKERENASLGALRNPDSEQHVIDFYLYNSDLVADTICTFAEAVKHIAGHDKTVGVFYGYTLQLCGETRQQNAGHLALKSVLASPHVDFLCSPTSYAFRQLGGAGTSHFMSLLGSVKKHGKLWFDENDIRTSLAPGKLGAWGKPADVRGDKLQQDKELANVLVNGAAQWWFDVGANRYDDPQLMQHLKIWTRAAKTAIEKNRSPADQIAFAVDESSLVYLKTGHRLGRWLLLDQLPALHRVGAPVGHYLASDLEFLTQHRMVILPVSFAPTEAQRKALDALKSNGRVLVFLYAPGLYKNGRLDPFAMEDFTGIRLALKEDPTPLRVTLGDPPHLPKPLHNLSFGTDADVAPYVTVADPDAAVCGRLPSGEPAFAIRQYPSWTAVFSAAPMLPSSLLRHLAERAGVHMYTDAGDVVWAARDLVALSIDKPGTRTLRLPRPARVRDVFSGKLVAERTDTIRVDMPEKTTRTFVLE